MSLVERCWMITSKFSVIAILIITGICFGVFVYPYMKKKREAALVSIVYIGIMSVLYLIPQQIGNFSAYMLGVMAAFLVMYVQDRRNIYQKIFLAVTFFSIRWLAVAMADRLDDFITKALVFGNTIAGRQWLQYGLYVGTRILDIVLCIVFLAVAIGLINKAYVYKNDEMNVEAEKFRKITMKVLTMQLNSITIMDLIAYGGAAQYVAYALPVLLVAAGKLSAFRLSRRK